MALTRGGLPLACVDCGYDLSGIDTCCPECGVGIEVSRTATSSRGRIRFAAASLICMCTLQAAAPFSVLLGFQFVRRIWDFWRAYLIEQITFAVLAAAVIVGWWSMSHAGHWRSSALARFTRVSAVLNAVVLGSLIATWWIISEPSQAQEDWFQLGRRGLIVPVLLVSLLGTRMMKTAAKPSRLLSLTQIGLGSAVAARVVVELLQGTDTVAWLRVPVVLAASWLPAVCSVMMIVFLVRFFRTNR
jgi:hypothetical protein